MAILEKGLLAGKGVGGVGGEFGEQDDTRKLNHIFPKVPKSHSAINLWTVRV